MFYRRISSRTRLWRCIGPPEAGSPTGVLRGVLKQIIDDLFATSATLLMHRHYLIDW